MRQKIFLILALLCTVVQGAWADKWFSLDGRKLDGKPTREGLYINNGNIVVIKQ